MCYQKKKILYAFLQKQYFIPKKLLFKQTLLKLTINETTFRIIKLKQKMIFFKH